jgi:hypothetical protein
MSPTTPPSSARIELKILKVEAGVYPVTALVGLTIVVVPSRRRRTTIVPVVPAAAKYFSRSGRSVAVGWA